MARRCRNCNGTGKEDCDVHGSHSCKECNGKGCTHNKWNPQPFPDPMFIPPKRVDWIVKRK